MSADAFGVYVHWPFCLAKCPYCDFNSHVRHGGVDQGDFVTAYLMELKHFAALAPGRIVSSIFFGGGTPSLMEPETVGAILDRIAELWPIETGRGDHTRSQSDIRRGWTVRRLPGGGREPRVARRSVARRCEPKVTRAQAHERGGACRARHRQAQFRARVLRPDLCAAGADVGGLARGARPRARATRRTISRSISSPSRRARRSRHFTPQGR